MTRTCKKCGKEKPLEEFVLNKGSKYGRGHICKKCSNEHKKAYNQSPEAKAYKKAYSQSPEAKAYSQSPERKAYQKAYQKAYAQERINELSDYYIKALLRRTGVKTENVTPQMIEMKREIMTMKRLEIKIGKEIA